MQHKSRHSSGFKRLCAMVLSLLMVFGLLPTTNYALPQGYVITNPGADVTTPVPPALQNGQVFTDKSVAYKGEGAFDITLTAAGQDFKRVKPKPADQRDIVLVLDTSGSMENNERLANLVEAADYAVEQLLSVEGNRIALVRYSDYAETVSNFSTNQGWLKGKLAALEADGGTNIQNGFLVAQSLITSRSDTTRKPIIILMSDGRPTYYHTSLTSHTSSNLIGEGYAADTTGAYVWHTILQAMKAKELVRDLKIYTIGFGVGSDAFATATLMPTDLNTATYRPLQYGADKRTATEEAEYEHYRNRRNSNSPWGQWQRVGGGDVRKVVTNYSARFSVEKLTEKPTDSWTPVTYSGNVFDVTSANSREQYGYRKGTRTGSLYDNHTSGPIPFQHTYFEEGSSIAGDSAKAIFDAFVKVVNEIVILSPTQEQASNQATPVVIEDILGPQFDPVEPLPKGVSFDTASRKLTWTLAGDSFTTNPADAKALSAENIHKVTIQVKLKSNAPVGKHYTNVTAQGRFTVHPDNPYYAEKPAAQVNVLGNNGWLSVETPDTQVKIGVTKVVQGPVDPTTSNTFKFNLYKSLNGGTALTEPLEISVMGSGSKSEEFTYTLPFGAFDEAGKATLYVEEVKDESGDKPHWINDNAARKPVQVSRQNPSGAVTFTNVYAPEGTLTVTKSWLGNGPKSNVNFDLLAKLGGEWGVVSSGHTILADDPKPVVISGLDLNVQYAVREWGIEASGEDYTTGYSAPFVTFTPSKLEQSIVIENTYNKPVGIINITKIWNFGDLPGNPGKLPDHVQVKITHESGDVHWVTLSPNHQNELGDWIGSFETHTFGTYTLEEIVPQDYTASANPKVVTLTESPKSARVKSVVFENNYVPPTAALTVTKVWAQDDLTDGFRPTSVTLKVFHNDEPSDLQITLPESDDTPWSHTFTNLPFGTYRVEEITTPDYQVTYSEPVTLEAFDAKGGISTRSGAIVVTNTFANPKGNILVTKVWSDQVAPDVSAIRPESITLTLTKNGEPFESVKLPNDQGQWSHNFTNLPLDGSHYGVQESSDDAAKLAQYAAHYPEPVQLNATNRSGQLDLVNSYGKGIITVTKVWKDGTNPVADQPTSATFKLYKVALTPLERLLPVIPVTPEANTSQDLPPAPPAPPAPSPSPEPVTTLVETRTVTRDASSTTFYNLDLGSNITYYVEEQAAPFYTTAVTNNNLKLTEEDAHGNITIVNTYTEPKGSLTVEKEWVHGNNPSPAEMATVTLLKDGEPLETVSFNSTHTFGDLQLGAHYTISEDPLDHYSVSFTTDNGYHPVKGESTVAPGVIKLKNTYIPEIGNLLVEKSFEGKVGAPIEVTLSRYYGEVLDDKFTASVTLSPENKWNYEFSGLEVYGPEGVPYVYVAQESGEDLNLYTRKDENRPTLTPGETTKLHITNVYAPNKGTLTIIKQWMGSDERPIKWPNDVNSIAVRLYIDGKPEENTMILSGDNGWSVTREGLSVDSVYKVVEETNHEAYRVRYSADEIRFSASELEVDYRIYNMRTIDKPELKLTKQITTPQVLLTNGKATLNYTIQVVNSGNRTLSNITLVDKMTVPTNSGATTVYNPAPAPVPAATDAESHSHYYLQKNLKPGEVINFTYTVTVDRLGTYLNDAQVSGTYMKDTYTAKAQASGTVSAPPVVNPPSTPDPDPTPSPTPSPVPTPQVAQGTVTATFRDTAGNTLSEPLTITGLVGGDYTTLPQTFPLYRLVTLPANSSGVFTATPTSVNYVYQLIGDITINDNTTPLGPIDAESGTDKESKDKSDDTVVLDVQVPLGNMLPQTGEAPISLLYGLGGLLASLGFFLRRKQ